MSFRWLKRYLPRSLFGRAALILILPVFGLQLIVTIAFIQRQFEDVTTQMSRSVAYELRYLQSAVNEELTLPEALDAVDEIAPPLDLTVTLPVQNVPQADRRRFYDFSGIVVISTFEQEIAGVRATALPDDREVIMWIGTDHGVMQVAFDRRRVSASNPHQLLVITIFFGVLLTTIAYLYLRNQLRPVTRLAEAAEEFGKGRIVHYRPGGATEVRSAGRACLEMRSRIERQSQARTMMLSGISHDLRTPLTRLRLGLSMVDEAEADPLRGDVDEMQHLIDAFLDFARDESEDEVLLTDPVDLVRGAVDDAQRGGRPVTLGASDVPMGEEVALKPMAIRRALDNLIGNALRYGTKAQVSVTLDDRHLRLVVEDDGPGIPPERRDEAVRPFVRLDPSRNQDHGSGVGLGLSIVADVARVHGGRLVLDDSAALGGLKAEIQIAR